MIYNELALIPWAIGLITSLLSGRTTLMWARAGAFHEVESRRHILWSLIGALAFPAQIALLIAGFFVFWWPIALALTVTALFAHGLFVTDKTIMGLTTVQPLMNLITVACAFLVWFILW